MLVFGKVFDVIRDWSASIQEQEAIINGSLGKSNKNDDDWEIEDDGIWKSTYFPLMNFVRWFVSSATLWYEKLF